MGTYDSTVRDLWAQGRPMGPALSSKLRDLSLKSLGGDLPKFVIC